MINLHQSFCLTTNKGRHFKHQDLLRMTDGNAGSENQPHLLIQSDDPATIICSCLAAWRQQKLPILDPKAVLNKSFGEPIPLNILENYTNKGPHLAFTTSGSTGAPKLWIKSLTAMKAEVEDLQRIYRLPERPEVASLVSIAHIYGWLHACMLPMELGGHVHFISVLDLLNDRSKIDLLVTVPAAWQGVKQLLAATEVGCLVSSGAPFGTARAEELRSLPNQPGRAVDILGSTETGGIGYQELLADDSVFLCLPRVQLRPDAKTIWIESPYFDGPAQQLHDRLDFIDSRTFRHRGRHDSVVKYSGKRFDLKELEDNLQAIFQREVKCLFDADPDHPKGGRLVAFVEKSGGPQDTATGRRQYLEQFQTPFPDQLHWLPVFPRDQQGKISLQELRNAANL